MPATFYSKAARFQLVLEPQVKVYGPNGQDATTPGKRIEFIRGKFVATEQEAKKLGLTTGELVERLREATTYGTEFFEPGNDPNQQHPATEDVLADVMSAVARGQHDKLVAILEREESTHMRPEVIEPVKRALAEVGDTERGKRGPGKPPVRQPAKAEIS